MMDSRKLEISMLKHSLMISSGGEVCFEKCVGLEF